MRACFLGTGGYHPRDGRHTSCIMLPELGIIFDAGTSFFRVADRLATRDLFIFLSHAHVDHIVGLTYFLVPMLSGKVDRACVRSAPEYLDAVKLHLFAPAVFPIIPPGYIFEPLADAVAVPAGGVLTHCRLNHPGGSIGYRIDWPGQSQTPGRSLAYITDTVADGSYVEFVRGVDVLIHECNFSDASIALAQESGHSCPTAVGRAARDADVKRLFLTHFDPQLPLDDPVGVQAARAIFPATEIARELMEFEF
jgi:ribonuclease BN (tRNA processing enzyme)